MFYEYTYIMSYENIALWGMDKFILVLTFISELKQSLNGYGTTL